eukprot:gene20119-30922_t
METAARQNKNTVSEEKAHEKVNRQAESAQAAVGENKESDSAPPSENAEGLSRVWSAFSETQAGVTTALNDVMQAQTEVVANVSETLNAATSTTMTLATGKAQKQDPGDEEDREKHEGRGTRALKLQAAEEQAKARTDESRPEGDCTKSRPSRHEPQEPVSPGCQSTMDYFKYQKKQQRLVDDEQKPGKSDKRAKAKASEKEHSQKTNPSTDKKKTTKLDERFTPEWEGGSEVMAFVTQSINEHWGRCRQCSHIGNLQITGIQRARRQLMTFSHDGKDPLVLKMRAWDGNTTEEQLLLGVVYEFDLTTEFADDAPVKSPFEKHVAEAYRTVRHHVSIQGDREGLFSLVRHTWQPAGSLSGETFDDESTVVLRTWYGLPEEKAKAELCIICYNIWNFNNPWNHRLLLIVCLSVTVATKQLGNINILTSHLTLSESARMSNVYEMCRFAQELENKPSGGK